VAGFREGFCQIQYCRFNATEVAKFSEVEEENSHERLEYDPTET
jgi:hypothetical protein